LEALLKFIKYLWSKFFKKIRFSAIKNSVIHRTSKIESGSQIVNSTMDRYSFCGYNCDIAYADIGAFCSIANGVVIGGGMHPIEWVSTSPVFYSGRDSVKAKFSEHQRPPVIRTTIGNDVWIGQNAIIKQGVKIGTGAVIGMGSIVTKNVGPYEIVAGNPAKKIRNRFDHEIAQRLLASSWWTLDENELLKFGSCIKNPADALRELDL
jgi:acetyltransferase-like isoleucine patch superfamily enzyme